PLYLGLPPPTFPEGFPEEVTFEITKLAFFASFSVVNVAKVSLFDPTAPTIRQAATIFAWLPEKLLHAEDQLVQYIEALHTAFTLDEANLSLFNLQPHTGDTSTLTLSDFSQYLKHHVHSSVPRPPFPIRHERLNSPPRQAGNFL
ncbi:hypothetical protein L0F63_005923, partial [Massospora cicadina]